MLFSSSTRSELRQDPTRAVKIFWKPFEEVEIPPSHSLNAASDNPITASSSPSSHKTRHQQLQRGEGQRKATEVSQHHYSDPNGQMVATSELIPPTAREEVLLPPIAFRDLRMTLEDSADYLPEPGRELKGWRVGLLERFNESECHLTPK